MFTANWKVTVLLLSGSKGIHLEDINDKKDSSFNHVLLNFKELVGLTGPFFSSKKNGQVPSTPHPLSDLLMSVHHLFSHQEMIQSLSHSPLPTFVVFPSRFELDGFNVQLVPFYQLLSEVACQHISTSMWPPNLSLPYRKN